MDKSKWKWLVCGYHGTEYAVPATMIAKNFADYYGGGERTWQEEFDWIMENEQDFELTDWAFNNMNPEDFHGTEVLIGRDVPSFSDVFTHCDGDYRVVIGDLPCDKK